MKRLQRAERKELARIKREQKTEAKRQRREHEKAVRLEQKRIRYKVKHPETARGEAIIREKKRKVSGRKTKRMFKRAWKKLI